MTHPIHQSPEERAAAAQLEATQQTANEVRGVHDAVQNLHKTAQDKSAEAAMVQEMRGHTQKLDEVKSAHLVTNRILKDISAKESPTNLKVELTNKPNDLAAAFFSMLKGDKGDTPTPQEITKLIKPLIPKPIKGDKGDEGDAYILTSEDKQDIARTITVPVVEKVIEKTEVIREQPIVTNEVKEVALKDSPDEVVEKVNQSTKQISTRRIEGLSDIVESVNQIVRNPVGQTTGGANQIVVQDEGTRVSDFYTTLNFVGAGVTASYLGNGIIAITIPGGSGTVYTETPSGTINGSNVTFTTLHTINNVFSFALNGQYLHPTTDYTTSGSTITFVAAPDASLSGLPFTIVYG